MDYVLIVSSFVGIDLIISVLDLFLFLIVFRLQFYSAFRKCNIYMFGSPPIVLLQLETCLRRP